MKKLLLISLGLLILASSGLANQLCTKVGLDQYIANYAGINNACQIGDKLFYDFTFSSSLPLAVTAAQTAVQPDPGDGVTDPGIIFSNGNFWVFAGQTSLDVTITYSIATNS